MKLIYRGTTFNYDPTNTNTHRSVKPIESAYELIYRGHICRVEPTAIKKTTVKSIEYELIYRGVTYQVQRSEQGNVIVMNSFANHSNQKASTNSVKQKANGKYSVEM